MLKDREAFAILLGAIVCICLVLLMLIGLPSSPVEAAPGLADQAGDAECLGLDFVVLLDESSSMRLNDRNKLRSNAVRTAIDIVGYNAVYLCPGVRHRIAVVGFGDRAQSEALPDVALYVPPTVISPSLEALETWTVERRRLKSAVPVSDDLGATDHEAALTEAAKILDTWSKEPIGTERRKRAVVLVTDGEPCVVDEGCTSPYKFRRELYMQRVQALTDPLGTQFPWRGSDNPDSVYIWLIGFQDNSRRDFNYLEDKYTRPYWDRITEGHGGQVLALQPGDQASMNANLTSVVVTILDPLLGSRLKSWDCQEPIWIDPYASNVTIIHVFHLGANPGVALEDVVVRIKAKRGDETIAEFSRGSVISGTGQVNDYIQDGPNESYVFYMPPPGKYSVEVEGADICQDLDVRIGQSGVNVRMLEPTEDAVFAEVPESPYYDTVTPSLFRFQLLQQSENEELPLKEDPDYPLDLSVRVRGQSDTGETIDDEYPMLPVDKTQAIYEARDQETDAPLYIHTPFPGDYTWELVGTTINPRGFDTEHPVTTPITVVNASGFFTVVPVQEYGFQVLEPNQNDVILASDIEQGKSIPVPVQVTIQLTDVLDQPLAPDAVLADDAADAFELHLSDENGRLVETAKLAWTAGEPNFSTRLRTLSADQTPDIPGKYQLEVVLLPNYDRGKYRPVITQQTVSFRRERAQEFDFEVSSPSEGAKFPLVEGVAERRLRAEVQVMGEDGRPLGSDLSIASPEASPFKAKLLDATGRVLDTQPMHPEAGNVYAAELGSGQADPNRYGVGCYQILIELTGDYRTQVFRPKKQEASPRNLCMVLVKRFDWQIMQPGPGPYEIHPLLGWFPPPQRLPLVVQIEAQDKKSLQAGDISGSQSNVWFVGQLLEPGRGTPYELSFEPGEKAGQFTAHWPSEADNKGDYVLEVWPAEGASLPAWIPASEEPQSQSFKREDNLLTMPWSLLALIILAIIVITAVILIILAVGRLFGLVLVFTKER